MSSSRYKRLLTNLPSMAAIVNSFQSSEVQLEVFKTLMDALEGTGGLTSGDTRLAQKSSTILTEGEVQHDLVEGDSIHSIASDD
ncbi:MAG: hypothetical protein R3C18_08760 [Planctomycetaceae bacterium]